MKARFLQRQLQPDWDGTILFVGHLFHDCDRTFGPGLWQTETNECAKHIPDRPATTSNCTLLPLPASSCLLLLGPPFAPCFPSPSFPPSPLPAPPSRSMLPLFLSTVVHPPHRAETPLTRFYPPGLDGRRSFSHRARPSRRSPPAEIPDGVSEWRSSREASGRGRAILKIGNLESGRR